MTFLRITTILIVLLIILELFNPGIISTGIPIPVIVGVLLWQLVWFGKNDAPYTKRTRTILTIVLTLTTMVLIAIFARGSVFLFPITFAAALIVAIATWVVTQEGYANH